jgi:hypothetical protein
MTAAVAAQARWIIEGVYGWLVEATLSRATALVWLDLSWEECRAGLLARGVRRGGDEASFAELLSWAEKYWVRQTPSSFSGHAQIFEQFGQTKFRLCNRADVNAFLRHTP